MVHGLYRAWKNRLKSIKEENRNSLYQALNILMSETDLAAFGTTLSNFLEYWSKEEPEFSKYFQEYYATRPGTINCSECVHVSCQQFESLLP